MARERKIQDGREGKREREKKIEQICVYIYTRERASWRRNKETEIEKRRVVGVREEERSVSRTTKRAEKHKSQATGARHVVCIGEVRITGTRSLPKDGAKAPCYVYCP